VNSFSNLLQEQKSTATGQSLVNLPEKSVETHPIKLSPEEQKVYDKVSESMHIFFYPIYRYLIPVLIAKRGKKEFKNICLKICERYLSFEIEYRYT
jgi:hypothetical protein